MKNRFLCCAILVLFACLGWAQQPSPTPAPTASPTPSPTPVTSQGIAEETASNGAQSARIVTIKQPFASAVKGSALTGFLATLRMQNQLHKPAGELQLDAVQPAAPMAADQINLKTYQIVLDLMDHRVDKQVGSTPDTKGTTSLAMKGAVPQILGFAVQHGAITQQVNGNTVTFRATPAGVLKALAGIDPQAIFGVATNATGQPIDPSCVWCNKISAAISFDVSQGPNAGTLTASKQQVQSWSVRAELVNHRDPRRRQYIKDFQKLGSTPYVISHQQLTAAFEASNEFKAWQSALVAEITAKVDEPLANNSITLDQARERATEIIKAALDAEEKIQLPDLDRALQNYANAIKPLLEQRNAIIDLANKGLLITADWTVTRDPNVPDLSTITGILENGLGPGRKYDLTVNLAAAFFNSTPKVPVHQFHDFKATAQYDIPLGTFQSYGPFVFSLASRYEFVPNDTLSPGGTITGTATTPMTAAPHGHLVVGQAKLTIPVKGSGVKIPFSISAANRTELIKEKDVRGNIGITFDLDTIFAQAGKNNVK